MDKRAPPTAPPGEPAPGKPGAREPGAESADVLRLYAEDASVSRQTVETARVRVAKVTRVRDHIVDELLACTNVEVERVPIGRVIDAVPPVKDEGDLLVVPVVEETLVVERRLLLKEELRIRRVHSTERYRDTVKLRYQTAEVTRVPAQKPTTDAEPVAGPARPNPEDT
jgi:stress response protein YsnF